MKYLMALIFTLAVFAVSCFAQRNDSCRSLKYENHNQVTPEPISVKKIEGRVSIDYVDFDGCVGLFEEGTEKLIAVTTLRNGKFRIGNIPNGKYRILIKHPYNAYCAANIPIEVINKSNEKRKIFVHLKPQAIDDCSFGELK
jgi:hypothetical protein